MSATSTLLRRALATAAHLAEPHDRSILGLARHGSNAIMRMGQLGLLAGLSQEALLDAGGDPVRPTDYLNRSLLYGGAGIAVPFAAALAPVAVATLGPTESYRLAQRAWRALPRDLSDDNGQEDVPTERLRRALRERIRGGA